MTEIKAIRERLLDITSNDDSFGAEEMRGELLKAVNFLADGVEQAMQTFADAYVEDVSCLLAEIDRLKESK